MSCFYDILIWQFFQFDGNFESDIKSYAVNGNSHASSGRTIFRSSHHVYNVLIEENPETTTKNIVCNGRNRWSQLWNRKRQSTAIKKVSLQESTSFDLEHRTHHFALSNTKNCACSVPLVHLKSSCYNYYSFILRNRITECVRMYLCKYKEFFSNSVRIQPAEIFMWASNDHRH